MRVARTLLFGTGLALSSLISSTPALAQPADNKVLAEQLFEQARALAKANRWAEACPKFEASLRYDAQLGTRLNLATCYEKIGRIASAWGLFRDSAELARAANDVPRRDYALKQAATLLPRLPKLTIAGPMTPPNGFVITRDGVPLDLAALGSALYVDPGPHEVTAVAPGFEVFKATINVAERQSESVLIRELTPLKPQPSEPTVVRPQEPVTVTPVMRRPPGGAEPIDDGPDPGKSRKYIGLGIAGTGVVLTGVGLFLGMSASSKYDDAKALCGEGLACENQADFERGQQLISDSRSQATLSTVFVVGGLAAAAAGVVVWVTAPKRERAQTAIVPTVSERDLGLAILGRF